MYTTISHELRQRKEGMTWNSSKPMPSLWSHTCEVNVIFLVLHRNFAMYPTFSPPPQLQLIHTQYRLTTGLCLGNYLL